MLLFYLINMLIHNPLQFLVTIVVIVVPLFMSITFHEWAHGYVAYKFGDSTPLLQGRLTLNPFAHLDPVGTLMLFLVGIGWAKPVMLNPLNCPSKAKQMLIALAGPAINILLAIVFGFISVFLQINSYSGILVESMNIVVRINLILAMFNLIPIPPLDGSKVFAWVLPEKLEYYYSVFEQYGVFLLLLLLFAGGFNYIATAVTFIQMWLLEFIKSLIVT